MPEHDQPEGTMATHPRRPASGRVLHAMSIDVEDYFHVAALARVVRPEQWDRLPSRVEANTERLLELFADQGVRSTFFVLGWVAERFPSLIRRIASAGHEVASHGYSHQLIYRQTPARFRDETRRSKQLLEDITGTPVTAIGRPVIPSPAIPCGHWIFWRSAGSPGIPVFSPSATTITASPPHPGNHS